ncbi:hypothetical protein [Planococcus antarcticus]|nr:hypothetical protein [Planococcus antarcticus]
MTLMVNGEKRTDQLAKTYLEMYKEYIVGYKQYKMEKAALCTGVEKLKEA